MDHEDTAEIVTHDVGSWRASADRGARRRPDRRAVRTAGAPPGRSAHRCADVPLAGAAAGVQLHGARFVVAAKDAGEPALIRHARAIEDAVACSECITLNYCVAVISPDGMDFTNWSMLPRTVR